MRKLLKSFLLGIVAVLLVSSSALSLTVFSDDFNAENGGSGVSNYAGFSKWAVDMGTVDLVGGGYWDQLALDGLSIDLDGTSGDAGRLTSVAFDVVAGQTYNLSFDMAGNKRNDQNDSFTVAVYISDYWGEVFTVSGNDDWQTITREVTISANTQAHIVFNHDGGDNVGALLDNVSFDSIAPVPEPATMLLFGMGLLGLAGVSRRKINA